MRNILSMSDWHKERNSLHNDVKNYSNPLEWLHINSKVGYGIKRVQGTVAAVTENKTYLTHVIIEVFRMNNWITSIDIKNTICIENEVLCKYEPDEIDSLAERVNKLSERNIGDIIEFHGTFMVAKNNRSEFILIATKIDAAYVIDHHISCKTPCSNCTYREERYPNSLPNECKECGHLACRNTPAGSIPVYREKTNKNDERIRA